MQSMPAAPFPSESPQIVVEQPAQTPIVVPEKVEYDKIGEMIDSRMRDNNESLSAQLDAKFGEQLGAGDVENIVRQSQQELIASQDFDRSIARQPMLEEEPIEEEPVRGNLLVRAFGRLTNTHLGFGGLGASLFGVLFWQLRSMANRLHIAERADGVARHAVNVASHSAPPGLRWLAKRKGNQAVDGLESMVQNAVAKAVGSRGASQGDFFQRESVEPQEEGDHEEEVEYTDHVRRIVKPVVYEQPYREYHGKQFGKPQRVEEREHTVEESKQVGDTLKRRNRYAGTPDHFHAHGEDSHFRE